jgi:hypothetical protein
LRAGRLLTPKNRIKPLKIPPAVTYRGFFCQKKFNGKEPDPETGLYYYGARYLDPKTSRWLSGDPALGEYLPVAPLDDQAKKRNGNLPGMGGIFNTVNMHAYHYAGNNPVRYVDPDGRKSGYVRKKDSVNRMGHAGVFVEISGGRFVFTEIIPIGEKILNYNPVVITKEENINAGGLVGIFNKEDIGAVQYTFNDKDKMLAFFELRGFSDYIEFETTPEQESAILKAATSLGMEFTNYDVPGNHCGIFVEGSLDAGGKGIKTLAKHRNWATNAAIFGALVTPFFPGKLAALWAGKKIQAPNDIGDQLRWLNDGVIVPIKQ